MIWVVVVVIVALFLFGLVLLRVMRPSEPLPELSVGAFSRSELILAIDGREVTGGPLTRVLPDGRTQWYAYVRPREP